MDGVTKLLAENAIDLKGKQYLQVVHRVNLFRENYGLAYTIDTEILVDDGKRVLMVAYIKDNDGKIGVDYVIDFEFLSVGFSNVMRRLGIDVQLEEIPQMRSDVKTHEGKFFNIKTYHDMYNSESIDIISKAFSNDIKMFGYTYD